MDLERKNYRGAPAFCLENSELSVTVVERGARIVSLYSKRYDREFLLQQPSEQYETRDFAGSYSDNFCAGIDDMFPTIDGCLCEAFPWRGTEMADHGEVFSLDWAAHSGDADLIMEVYGVRFPYHLKKELRINGSALHIHYWLTNLSAFALPCLWALHPAFCLDRDSKVKLPEMGKVISYSLGNRMGDFLEKARLKTDADGLTAPQTVLGTINGPYMDKFYFEKASHTLESAILHPDGSSLTMSVNGDMAFYLGVLFTDGMHLGNCVLLEPCTAPFDRPDCAERFGIPARLNGNGALRWEVVFAL